MKTVAITIILSLAMLATSAVADMITFDSKATGQVIGLYQGVDFGIMTAYTYNEYNTNYNNTQSHVSGDVFGYFADVPGESPVLSITSANEFIFDGSYLAGWAAYDQGWYNARSVTVQGYLDKSLVAAIRFDLTPQMQYFATNWTLPVDTLEFIPDAPEKYFLMDNFTYTPYTELASLAPNPVPEPSTLLLFGAGLAGTAIFRRKNRN